MLAKSRTRSTRPRCTRHRTSAVDRAVLRLEPPRQAGIPGSKTCCRYRQPLCVRNPPSLWRPSRPTMRFHLEKTLAAHVPQHARNSHGSDCGRGVDTPGRYVPKCCQWRGGLPASSPGLREAGREVFDLQKRGNSAERASSTKHFLLPQVPTSEGISAKVVTDECQRLEGCPEIFC